MVREPTTGERGDLNANLRQKMHIERSCTVSKTFLKILCLGLALLYIPNGPEAVLLAQSCVTSKLSEVRKCCMGAFYFARENYWTISGVLF